MEESNLILEAKKELTNELIKIMSPMLYQGLKTIWNGAKDVAIFEKSTTSLLKIFQDKLTLIPKWNQDIINNEYNRIILDNENCDKDCFDRLIEGVFISNVKILSSIKLTSNSKHLNVSVPNSKHFLHKCYIECARNFYTHPFLFDDRPSIVSNKKMHRNLEETFKLIYKAIEDTIRGLLPIKNILHDIFNTESNTEFNTNENKSDDEISEKENESENENESERESEQQYEKNEFGSDNPLHPSNDNTEQPPTLEENNNTINHKIEKYNDILNLPTYMPDLEIVEGDNIQNSIFKESPVETKEIFFNKKNEPTPNSPEKSGFFNDAESDTSN